MAILLLAGCGTEESSPGVEVAGITVDSITTREGVKQLEYRNAKSGERYRMRASLGETGWIESVATKDKAESVRIDWTPTTVSVETSRPDGISHVYYAGVASGIAQVKPEALRQRREAIGRLRDEPVEALPFLLESTTQAADLLAAPHLASPLGLAHELLSGDAPKGKVMVGEAQTFPCDESLDISNNCGVEAKMEKNTQEIFNSPAYTFQDKNVMNLKCGDADGMVRIQACPLAAYDCNQPGNRGAKVEAKLAAGAVTDDKGRNSNEACTILAAESEGIDEGRKFDVKGTAEIRPGKVVRPKDPTDEAKHPDACKLVWDFPEKTSRVYHSQFKQGHDKDTTSNRTSFEIPITAAAATGNLAIGGKALIDVNVQTCQDSEWGQDDYAIIVRGTRSNALYTCAAN